MSKDVKEIKPPHRIVRASAGSGKTYRLTNEFMIRLFRGEQPGAMLATTFTRAAAGEILHRVLERLSGAVVDGKKLDELCDALDLGKLTQDRCERVLSDLVSQLHRLSILTIDSFFARLAGSFSFELGLPMTYRMLDEDEDEELKSECVDLTISGCSREEMVEILRSLQGDKIQMRTHSAIMKLVSDGYAMYLATDGDESAWEAIPAAGMKLDDAEIEECAELLGRCEVPSNVNGKPNSPWIKAKAKCVDLIRNKAWLELLSGGLGGKMIEPREAFDELKFSTKLFPDSVLNCLSPVIDHARFVLSTEHNRRTRAVYELMNRFDSVYRESKMQGGRLTFDDPPRLLNEAQITGELEHVYYRLDTTLRHVMLDEFQDTSMPQFRLLEPILDELLSQDEEERSVFVVGDVKQSLYTWRQAEPKLLGGMERRWETLKPETLAKSYRSSPKVLDGVNEIFGDLNNNAAMRSSKPGQDAARAWHEQYDWHKGAKTEIPGEVTLRVADIDESADQGEKPDEATEVLWACAARVAEARAQSPGASIAVLIRQGKHIYPLLSMLDKLGVDACENRGNPLVDSPAVASAVSMLELIEHPGNSAALGHVIRTPLAGVVGLSEDNAGFVASSLRERIVLEGCVPVLTEWFKACAGSMDSRGVVRFEQLIELAASLENDGRSGAGTLAMVAQSRRIDEPGHAPVRVMTIHSSKGLEFDVVVLPLLGQSWRLRPDTLLSRRDMALGPISQVTRYPAKHMQQVSPELGSLYHDSLLKQINEELCCLYVATTRAKRSLQMIVPADKDGRAGEPTKNLSAGAAHMIRESLAPGEVAEPGALLYEHKSDEPWAAGLDDGEGTATIPDEELVELRVRASDRLGTAKLASASPSTMSGGGSGVRFKAGVILGDESFGASAREHGLCVHAGFESLVWIDAAGFDSQEVIASLKSKSYTEEQVATASDEISEALKAPKVARLFDEDAWLADHPSSKTANAHGERSFAVRLATGEGDRLVQGRFDRLVVGRGSDGVTGVQIVDFKTDRAAEGMNQQQLDEYSQKHRGQLDAYRRSASQMYRIDPGLVEVVLVYTRGGGVVYLGFDD